MLMIAITILLSIGLLIGYVTFGFFTNLMWAATLKFASSDLWKEGSFSLSTFLLWPLFLPLLGVFWIVTLILSVGMIIFKKEPY